MATASQVGQQISQAPNFRTVNSYNANYWSGQDAAVYFNDLFIGEIVNLQYEVQEAVWPLKSYADYTKQRVAHGARQVSGSFTINYQQALLFWLVLEQIRNPTVIEEVLSVDIAQKPSSLDNILTSPRVGTTLQTAVPTLTTSFITAIHPFLAAGITSPPLLALLGTAGAAVALTPATKTKAQQSGGWLDKLTQATNAAATSLLSRVKESLRYIGGLPYFETGIDGFVISVYLGDTDPQHYQEEIKLRDGGDGPPVQSFAQKMADAVENNTLAEALRRSPKYCVESITGVEITGCSKIIDDSGRPLLQSYSFIASDILPGAP